jgi:hypothetical protein
MNKENKYYVYLHRLKGTNQVFYVGKGCGYRSVQKAGRTSEWIEKSLIGYTVEIVKDHLSIREAIDLETELFYYYKETLINKVKPSLVKEINYEFLSSILEISEDSVSGLIWKKDALLLNGGIRRLRGKRAGRLTSGYWVIRLFGKALRVNRVVYSLFNKTDLNVDLLIDHKDGDRSNNSPENLEAVTHAQNARNKLNSSSRLNEDTGVTGVSRVKLGKYDYYMTQWRTIDCRNKSKSFNISTYGEQEALRLATEWRKEQIRLLNEQGAGYTERHGT